MAALWLASYPDGGVRKCSPGRPRACLATQRWFQELLDEHGEGVADSMLYMLQQGGKVRGQHGMTKVHGLIRVTAENCSSNDSGVTPWHRESQLQRLLYDLPLDDYDVAVVDYQGCEELQEISHKLSRFQGSGGLSAISWTMPLFVAHWADAAGQVALHGGISASEQLRRWGFHDADANCVPVITVPYPIAFLIMEGRWSRILLLVRWHQDLHLHRCRRHSLSQTGPLAGWPPPGSAAWSRCGASEPPVDLQDIPALDVNALLEISGSVRQWAPSILAGSAGEACREELERVLTRLDKWTFSWQQAMGMLNLPRGASAFRHDSRKLLSAVRMSAHLKGGPRSLVDVLAKSLALALPEFLRADFIAHTLKPTTLPSRATIQRGELALDVALMLLQRLREQSHGQNVIRIAWADSSPLAGYDWIWSQYHEIPVRDLPLTFKAVQNY